MPLSKVKGTTERNGLYYLQAASKTHGVARKCLLTDSPSKAAHYIDLLTPLISRFKAGEDVKSEIYAQIDSLTKSAQVEAFNDPMISHGLPISTVSPIGEEKKEELPDNYMSLAHAYKWFCDVKGEGKGKAIRGKKTTKAWGDSRRAVIERHMRVLINMLGEEKDIHSITENDMRSVLDVVVNMPCLNAKEVTHMSINEIIALAINDEIPDEIKSGSATTQQHFKTYSLFFKSFLMDEEEEIVKNPIARILVEDESVSYGKYDETEIKRFIKHALHVEKREWFKWIILTLIYSGARTGDITTLTIDNVKQDNDSGRWFLDISKGKTKNAIRKIPVHPQLLEWGFLDYVKKCNGYLFPVVATTNRNKLHKMFSTLRDSLNIPAVTSKGERRIVHSLRHTVSTNLFKQAGNDLIYVIHIQQVLGHKRIELGVTDTYLPDEFDLKDVCYVIDSLNWLA